VTDCGHIMARLSEHLDGEIQPEMRQLVEAHLAKCPCCSLIYNTTRRTLNIVAESGTFAIPVSAGTRLQTRLKELLAG